MANALDSADRVPEQTRDSTYSGYAHVSSLTKDFCPRRYAIIHDRSLVFNSTITGGHKVTFKQGRAIEEHVRESFIKNMGAHKVYAKWERSDGTFYNGPCNARPGEKQTFHEVDVESSKYNIRGHPDLIIQHNGLHVVEIKSMAKGMWDDLEEPLIEHKAQALMYVSLLQEQGLDVGDECIFIYVTKDFKFGSPYKEFRVNIKDYESLIDSIKKDALALKLYYEESVMPDKICPVETCGTAKKCSVAGRCFHEYG